MLLAWRMSLPYFKYFSIERHSNFIDCIWKSKRLNPVSPNKRLGEVEQADVVADGVGVIVGMNDDLTNISCLLFFFKSKKFNSSSNNMHCEWNLSSATVSSCQNPVLANDRGSTEMCCSSTAKSSKGHLPRELAILGNFSTDNSANSNLFFEGNSRVSRKFSGTSKCQTCTQQNGCSHD